MLVFELPDGKQLKNAVTPLLHLTESAAIISTPEGFSLQTSDTDDPAVIAVLRINASSNFSHYSIDYLREIGGINLAALDTILATTRDSESISAIVDYTQGDIDVFFKDTDTSATRSFETEITDLPENYVEIDKADYSYDVIVGIPSHCLRQIVTENSRSGVVFVKVTHEQVTLTTAIGKVVLKIEDGQCIIGGVQEGHQVGFHLNLKTVSSSFVEASQFSERVWICKSRDAPSLLNCPVGSVGNIMFFFDKWLSL